jgi:hypothetical protein
LSEPILIITVPRNNYHVNNKNRLRIDSFLFHSIMIEFTFHLPKVWFRLLNLDKLFQKFSAYVVRKTASTKLNRCNATHTPIGLLLWPAQLFRIVVFYSHPAAWTVRQVPAVSTTRTQEIRKARTAQFFPWGFPERVWSACNIRQLIRFGGWSLMV